MFMTPALPGSQGLLWCRLVNN